MAGNGTDMVDHPSHYTSGGIECIDAIEAATGDGFAGYCQGNAIKYLWRYDKKGKPVEDLCKAKAYIDFLISHIEKGGADGRQGEA